MEFDFTENAQVSDINVVPEKYRGLYQEADDGSGNKVYALSEAAKPLAEAYDGVNKTLKDVQNKKKQANDESAQRRQTLKGVEETLRGAGFELDENKDITEQLKGALDDLTSKAKNGEQIKVDMDKVKADADKRVNEVTQNKDSEIKAMQSALHKHLVSDHAVRAISEEKGTPELLQPIVERHAKVVNAGADQSGTPQYQVVITDNDGDARSDGKGGYMTVRDFVSELKKDQKFARAFESETPSGTGASPGSMNRAPGQNGPGASESKTSRDKIAAGLNKGQHRGGSQRRVLGGIGS